MISSHASTPIQPWVFMFTMQNINPIGQVVLELKNSKKFIQICGTSRSPPPTKFVLVYNIISCDTTGLHEV